VIHIYNCGTALELRGVVIHIFCIRERMDNRQYLRYGVGIAGVRDSHLQLRYGVGIAGGS